MQPLKLLHKRLEKELPEIHKMRLKSLVCASQSLIKCHKLSLTALGRNILGKPKTRSNIKKVDRLLGNSHMHSEVILIYKTMSNMLITENTQPWIHVDWSCLSSKTMLYVLRASLSMQGRSIVLYEEVHPKKNENNHETHLSFLKNLKSILPGSIKPVIITDAGFRGLWFNAVSSLGWDFVGRLRNKNLVCLDSKSEWGLSKLLYEGATDSPKYLGKGMLTKRQKIPCHFVVYKGKKKHRHKLNKDNSVAHGSKSKQYSKAYKEPWLLVTSLTVSPETAPSVINMYNKRMQIEENFRDTKSTRYGFGLNESGSKTEKRMSVLLLIGAIATFVCWFTGILVRKRGGMADYQAHSAKFTSVLSVVYLGREALKKTFKMTKKEFTLVLKNLINMAAPQLGAVF